MAIIKSVKVEAGNTGITGVATGGERIGIRQDFRRSESVWNGEAYENGILMGPLTFDKREKETELKASLGKEANSLPDGQFIEIQRFYCFDRSRDYPELRHQEYGLNFARWLAE